MFEHAGVDTSCFTNTTMRNLKRSCRRFGKCLGHMFWGKLINYTAARHEIYKPAYEYMLRWCCREETNYLTYLNEHNKTNPKLCFVFVTCWVINRTFRKIDF